MEAVKERGRRKKHERAVSRNNLHSELRARPLNDLTVAPLTFHAINPDKVDACTGALSYDILKNGGWSHEERGGNGWMDIAKLPTALAVSYFLRQRVHRENFIPAIEEFPEQCPAEIPCVAGNPHHRKPPDGEELPDEVKCTGIVHAVDRFVLVIGRAWRSTCYDAFERLAHMR